jgi:Uma2 family endonuclease
MTLEAKPRGAEADSSSYVGENAARMRTDDDIDLGRDPAPELVVEIDLSRQRIDKKTLYVTLGLAEFWRYDGRELRAYHLRVDGFPDIARSARLANVPIAEFGRFLALRNDMDRAALIGA